MTVSRQYNKYKGYIPLFFLLILFSCKKETSKIGLDLIGDESLANAIDLEYSTIYCNTEDEDSFSNFLLGSNSLLGMLNDPIFGQYKASLVVQPKLIETGIDVSNSDIDSIKLVLRYDLSQTVGQVPYLLRYGDTAAEMSIEVFKLNEDFKKDTVYYSDYTPSVGAKIGGYSGKFNFNERISIVGGDTLLLPPQLSINLDLTFGQEILDYGSTVFADNETFITQLRGLVVAPSHITSGDGFIFGVETFNSTSELVLYYNDSLELNIPLGVGSQRINYVETNHSSVIELQKGSQTHFNKTYVQGLGGTKVRIQIPGLDTFIKQPEAVVINEAKLFVPIDEISVDIHKYINPPGLWLFVPDKDNPKLSLTQDENITSNDVRFSYATFDSSKKGYTFYISRYLQHLIQTHQSSGENDFNGFYLSVPINAPTLPYRAVIDSDTSSNTMKLTVKYTKLN